MKKNEEKITKSAKKTKKEEMSETHSHHVRTRCRIHGCEAVVSDIRRHLLVHVKQGQLHPEDIDSHAEVMRHGKRKHVVSKSNPEVRGTAKKQKRRKKGGVQSQTARRCASD